MLKVNIPSSMPPLFHHFLSISNFPRRQGTLEHYKSKLFSDLGLSYLKQWKFLSQTQLDNSRFIFTLSTQVIRTLVGLALIGHNIIPINTSIGPQSKTSRLLNSDMSGQLNPKCKFQCLSWQFQLNQWTGQFWVALYIRMQQFESV